MAEIVRTEGVLGGDPRLDGTRICVLDVYELVAQGDHPPVDVADQLDISLGEVYSALAYYHEHPEEMRTVRDAHDRDFAGALSESIDHTGIVAYSDANFLRDCPEDAVRALERVFRYYPPEDLSEKLSGSTSGSSLRNH